MTIFQIFHLAKSSLKNNNNFFSYRTAIGKLLAVSNLLVFSVLFFALQLFYLQTNPRHSSSFFLFFFEAINTSVMIVSIESGGWEMMLVSKKC